MWNVMFETPQMEKDFFELLPEKKESGGLLFISSEPVFGGRRLFQRAFRVRRAPYFIRSFIVTNNAASKPGNSYSPENIAMMQGIAKQTVHGRLFTAIPWHSHPVGSDIWPSVADWNHWWSLWKWASTHARGAVVSPMPKRLRIYDFGVKPNGTGLAVANVETGHLLRWDQPELTEARKLFKVNKVN